ncbi:MAG: hypothetical protein EOO88_36915 [Pedobacter sp.]|nr:MAG: hypothetical protein EOO88_36915 [Pedobacter sp.]
MKRKCVWVGSWSGIINGVGAQPETRYRKCRWSSSGQFLEFTFKVTCGIDNIRPGSIGKGTI